MKSKDWPEWVGGIVLLLVILALAGGFFAMHNPWAKVVGFLILMVLGYLIYLIGKHAGKSTP